VSVVLLVRHGQASWGAADYDRLSEPGEQQSRVLGAALASRGVHPELLVRGSLRRHRQTTDGLLAGAGWGAAAPAVDEDAGWDEFDHRQMLELHPTGLDEGEVQTREEFQRWFEAATLRWIGGAHADEYDESFEDFSTRVEAALGRLVDRLGPSRTAVVVTSGGPTAWVVASLLGGRDLWTRLNPVMVNAAVTKVVVGRRGSTVVSFNDHSHLEAVDAGLITYR
jgi:broad specificity phosphatase PhoE